MTTFVSAEVLTFGVILLAMGGLYFLKKMRGNKIFANRVEEFLENIEDTIEETTGLDVELNEVVEEVMETVADAAEEVLEDLAEDGDLDTDLNEVAEEIQETLENAADEVIEDIVEDLNENLEETLGKMTVNALKDMLKERGLPVSGKKADLIARLIEA